MHFGLECHENRRPVAAGVGFRQRTADRTPIAHLHVGDSGGAIVDDGYRGGDRRSLNLCMPRQRAETQRAVLLLDVRGARNKVQIHEVPRVGIAELHQRDEALAPGQQLGIVADLRKHGRRFLQRSRAVIVKGSGIHLGCVASHESDCRGSHRHNDEPRSGNGQTGTQGRHARCLQNHPQRKHD